MGNDAYRCPPNVRQPRPEIPDQPVLENRLPPRAAETVVTKRTHYLGLRRMRSEFLIVTLGLASAATRYSAGAQIAGQTGSNGAPRRERSHYAEAKPRGYWLCSLLEHWLPAHRFGSGTPRLGSEPGCGRNTV